MESRTNLRPGTIAKLLNNHGMHVQGETNAKHSGIYGTVSAFYTNERDAQRAERLLRRNGYVVQRMENNKTTWVKGERKL